MQESGKTPTLLATINRLVLTMVNSKLAQIEHLSQDISQRFKTLNDLMSQSWIEHELIRSFLRDLMGVYSEWLQEKDEDHAGR